MKIAFIVAGEPKGKERPRFCHNGQIYTPKQTTTYEQQIIFDYYKQCGNVKFDENSQLDDILKAVIAPMETSEERKRLFVKKFLV